ncbi:MAG: ATP-binding cassette domain-containing protein [Methylococcaceae bacterium]
MPALIQLLRSDPDFPKIRLAILLMLSAVAGGGMLITVNLAIEEIAASVSSSQVMMTLLLLLVLTVATQFFALSQMAVSLENAVLKKRLLLAARLRYADLGYLVDVLDAPSRAILVKDSQIISQAVLPAILLVRSMAVMVFILIYLVTLSPIFSLVTAVTLVLYLVIQRAFIQPWLMVKLATTWASHQIFFQFVQRFLTDTREIRQSRRSSDEALAQYNRQLVGLTQEKKAINLAVVGQFTFGYTLFHLMLLSLLVFVPGLIGGWETDTLKLVLATLYLMMEVMSVLGHFPSLARASAAVEEMNRLDGVIQKSPHFESPGRVSHDPTKTFSSVQMDKLHLRRFDAAGGISFELGPLDLSIKAGEWIGITGSSGCGKTTLLSILTGIQSGFSGSYLIDGLPMEPDNLPIMRELFAVAWSETPSMLALHSEESRQMPHWLEQLDLTTKLHCVEGLWVPRTPLSTAESKRVLLLKTILEDRPILVVDGILGEQDPEFLERLYQEILPSLKRMGKTLIVVSRDETCLAQADRILTLVQGKIREA